MKRGIIFLLTLIAGGASYYGWDAYQDRQLANDLREFTEKEVPDLQRLLDEITLEIEERTDAINQLKHDLERTNSTFSEPIHLYQTRIQPDETDASPYFDTVGYPIFKSDKNELAYGVITSVNPKGNILDRVLDWRVVHPGHKRIGTSNLENARNAPGIKVTYYADRDLARWVYKTAQLYLMRERMLESRDELFIGFRKSKLTPGNDSDYAERAEQVLETTDEARDLFSKIQLAIESDEE